MTTRLATQRNYVTIRPINNSSNKENRKQNNLNINSNTISTTASNHGTDIIPLDIIRVDNNNENQNNREIIIEEVISPKKIILQTEDSLHDVINVVPLDVSETSNDGNNHQTIQTTDDLVSTDSNAATIAQQIGAQVTLVASQPTDDNDSPQYITVTVSAQEHGGPESYQVQYVNPDIYNNSQGQSQMSYPFCAVGDYQSSNNQSSYYTTTSNYTSATNTPTTHTSMPYIVPVEENILLSSTHNRDSPQDLTEVTYIPESLNTSQATTSNTSGSSSQDQIVESKIGINHALRISPATVHWLIENYETADGVSLPRSLLYNHYKQHCDESKIEAVNAASFGKLIRSVFENLRTRRLGTRGNSKYHYYGIRLKAGSSLTQIMEEKSSCSYSNTAGSAPSINKTTKKTGSKPESFESCSQYLGDGSTAIPILPNIDFDDTMLHEITLDDIEIFRSMYKEHCELFLDAVLSLEFSSIETLWRDFWRASDNNDSYQVEEKCLPKSKLFLMCQGENVQRFIKEVDYVFYQNMVEVLMPDVLRSIPNSLTQAIRNFAKNLEIWLNDAMAGCPEKVIQIKSNAVSAFCQTLRRYTSLNHLAQAARAVLQNSTQISQMLNDLNRVDFHNVQEQAAWVCQCDTAIVQRLENDFKTALQQQNTLEQWAIWLRLVVDSALEEYRGTNNYAKAARQFLLKWSFYSSMVIRDLTLRSASSFGSFHLIRLLYDEYMFFLIEHKVAEAQNRTAIAVMSEKMQRDGDIEFSYQLEMNPNKRLKIEM